jgi:hypothetical protein
MECIDSNLPKKVSHPRGDDPVTPNTGVDVRVTNNLTLHELL